MRLLGRVRLCLPATVALQRLPSTIQPDERHLVSFEKVASPMYLMAIAVFVNGAKGHAALHLSRDLNVQYKTAFALSHKLREAMGSQVHSQDQSELSGTVEIDGMYAGGNMKPENKKTDRVDRRLAEEQTGRRSVVVVAREVMGRTVPFIVRRESDAVPLIRKHVA